MDKTHRDSTSHYTLLRRTISELSLRREYFRISRWPGIVFGVGTQLFFLSTIYFLFFFLRDGTLFLRNQQVKSYPLLFDTFLTLQFAVIHSILLHPKTQKQFTKVIPKPFYGCFFCSMTCLTLLATIFYWRSSSTVLYDAQGTALKWVLQAGFYASWVSLFYSLHLSGLGYQTGLTPWAYWFLQRPQPRREFEERGAYCFFRHPIYLSFLGLIWFSPRMTTDHLILTGVWTCYIFVGSYLKDERLAFYLGARYREYQSRVPGYPLISRGPLGYFINNDSSQPQQTPTVSQVNHSSRKAA